MEDTNELARVTARLFWIISRKLGTANVSRIDKTRTVIINSMTVHERSHPHVIKGSRRRRIAAGSGTTVQDVNRLLKQFDQMKKMMKMIGRKGKMKQMLSAGQFM